jgi:hypothetical protein
MALGTSAFAAAPDEQATVMAELREQIPPGQRKAYEAAIRTFFASL